jgi:hypothetical protein
MTEKDLHQLITESLAIEADASKDAGTIGFISRALTQATLPHRSVAGNEFTRCNGYFTLSIMSPSRIGLPYGVIPRLILAWVTSEAVRIRSPELELGPSLSHFMRELGMVPTGGRWGSILRLREQMVRLFASSVTCIYEDDHRTGIYGVKIIQDARLWWDPKSPEQIPLWNSTLTLGLDFYNEIIANPIPVDMNALKALKKSPMALDIYCWLTYRLSYLNRTAEIPWEALATQFGADYGRIIDFKNNFTKQLDKVLKFYPQAQVAEGQRGLVLKPSRTHVARAGKPVAPRFPRVGGSREATPSPFQELPQELPESPSARVAAVKALPPPSAPKVIRLATETYEKAKQAAPGWDVYVLEHEWREWIADKTQPTNPDAAFIGFCKQRFQKKGRP